MFPHAELEYTQSINRKQLEVNRLWNSALLIHKLPEELLIKIFSKLQADPRASSPEPSVSASSGGRASAPPIRVTDWPGLMLVCSYWRNLLVSYPAFWRIVDTKRHVEWTKLCLDRSASASLDVRAGVRGRCPLDILYPHVHRFQKLYFFSSAILRPLFGHGMPLLHTLEFCTDVLDPQRRRVDLDPYLTSHSFPLLQIITLERVVLPGDKSLYAQLRTLSLCRCFHNLSINGFLDALAGCAQLEELTRHNTLHSLSGAWTHRGPVPGRQPISLPSLRQFFLHERGISLIPHFLAHLHIPESTFLRVTSDLSPNGDAGGSSDSIRTLSTLLPPNRSQALPILSVATRVIMSLLAQDWSICALKLSPSGIAPIRRRREYSQAEFVLYLDEGLSLDRWVAHGLGDLTGCFGGSPLTRLELQAEDHIFRTFSLLEELVVGRGRRAELSKVFRGLHAASNADSPIACLKLKRVSAEGFGSVVTHEAMRECFQRRADRGACLEVLDLRMHTDKDLTSEGRSGFIEDLRKVVGRVRVRDY
ncbi:hypothetical protein V8D89_000754 [Ganoderma adspersum]